MSDHEKINELGKLLREDDLTPQRICRFVRENTRKFLQERGYPSYLYRKYSTRDPKYFDILFRGAEYLDDLTEDQKNYLLQTVTNMDNKLNSRVAERVIRVFEAKMGIQNLLLPVKT